MTRPVISSEVGISAREKSCCWSSRSVYSQEALWASRGGPAVNGVNRTRVPALITVRRPALNSDHPPRADVQNPSVLFRKGVSCCFCFGKDSSIGGQSQLGPVGLWLSMDICSVPGAGAAPARSGNSRESHWLMSGHLTACKLYFF